MSSKNSPLVMVFGLCAAISLLLLWFGTRHAVPRKTARPQQVPSRAHGPTKYSPTPEQEVGRLPSVALGDSCKKADMVLGKRVREDEHGIDWITKDLEVYGTKTLRDSGEASCAIKSFVFIIREGRLALTPDGVALGRDSVSRAEILLANRLTSGSESVDGAEGNWGITITPSPALDGPVLSYGAWMDEGRSSKFPSGPPAVKEFRNCTVTSCIWKMR